MNVFKRILVGIVRHPGRFISILICVLLLGTMMSGAIMINLAIRNTDDSLRSRLPAVAMILLDADYIEANASIIGEFELEPLTIEAIIQVGNLPYVRSFDFSSRVSNFFSYDLQRFFNSEPFVETFGRDVSDWIDHDSLSAFMDTDLESFKLKGGHYPDIIDVGAGLITITSGRTFNQYEIDNLSYVAVISQDLLLTNNMYIGDFLAVTYIVFDELGDVLNQKVFELEIIGVFESEAPNFTSVGEIQSFINLLNRIYVPNNVIEAVLPVYMDVLSYLDMDRELYEEWRSTENIEDVLDFDDFLFLLYDPIDLHSFATAANRILPSFWRVDYLSNIYAEFSNSMGYVNELATQLLIGAVVATTIILSLIIQLLLIEKKKEIGIYLSLGEKKSNILWQFVLESMTIVFIGITISLFTGRLLSERISLDMIENHFVEQLDNPNRVVHEGRLESMGFRVEMSTEEMLDLYDVRIDSAVVLSFYVVALGTTFISVLVPTYVIVNMKPKHILSKGNIG